MTSTEQVSLFSRLLETLIRHALKNQYDENNNLTQPVTTKQGSELINTKT